MLLYPAKRETIISGKFYPHVRRGYIIELELRFDDKMGEICQNKSVRSHMTKTAISSSGLIKIQSELWHQFYEIILIKHDVTQPLYTHMQMDKSASMQTLRYISAFTEKEQEYSTLYDPKVSHICN